MAEQRYQAVLALIGEGGTVTEVAGRWGVSRQSVRTWLARYEAGGLEGHRETSGLAWATDRLIAAPSRYVPWAEARNSWHPATVTSAAGSEASSRNTRSAVLVP